MSFTKYSPLLIVGALTVFLTGCSVGYRHTAHGSTMTRDDGRELDIRGKGDAAQLYASIDFRYFRFGVPFDVGRRRLFLEDQEGNKDQLDLIRERRIFRLDVPVLSLRDLEEKQFGGYPGLMRHRHSIELWISGESDLATEHEWWADIGIVYYKYNGIGLRAYGGVGSLPFTASTPVQGTRFPRIWEGRAPMFGAGIELTVTAGEFGLDVLHFLLGIDREHRERSRKYGWD